jgi:hypothetical protein
MLILASHLRLGLPSGLHFSLPPYVPHVSPNSLSHSPDDGDRIGVRNVGLYKSFDAAVLENFIEFCRRENFKTITKEFNKSANVEFHGN